jgi:HK97 family phage prohead protease
MAQERPPRDNIVRAIFPGVELRAAGDGAMPILAGHFAVFNQWTRIDSAWEGTFMERLLPGSFRKTISENRDAVRVLFQHGQDPQVGDKPLGPIEELTEDREGVAYAVPLLDTSYNRDLLPGLQAGLYGASFRFRVMKEELDQKPSKSAYNPDALPERSISEVQLAEFGPVTFPAYAGATAGIRSMTDDYLIDRLMAEPRSFEALLARAQHPHPDPEPDPPARSLAELAGFLLADPTALSAAITKLGQGEPLLAQEAELLEAAIEHLEPPDDDEDDMGMNSAQPDALPNAGAGPATPPRAAARPRKFDTREDFLEWISRI